MWGTTEPNFPLRVKKERQVAPEDEIPEMSCMDIFQNKLCSRYCWVSCGSPRGGSGASQRLSLEKDMPFRNGDDMWALISPCSSKILVISHVNNQKESICLQFQDLLYSITVHPSWEQAYESSLFCLLVTFCTNGFSFLFFFFVFLIILSWLGERLPSGL